MLKRLELTDPNSCMCSANDDEPVFVLRAHDELAPGLVRDWAERYLLTKTGDLDPNALGGRQATKFHEALALADAMEEWADANPD